MLGKENDWEHHRRTSRRKFLQASSVCEVSERGMEVGSHTMTHPRLSGLNPEKLVQELDNSQQALSEIVCTPVEGFCYPYWGLDRAELQAGERLAGMGSLPGKEAHLHSPPLAAGVLGLHLLLVGELGSPEGRDIARDYTRRKGIRAILRNPDAGRGKGATLERSLRTSRGRRRCEG
jgi:peptidoglycan/xylan/chitin deacetylase (PgdA/CDA1 family)